MNVLRNDVRASFGRAAGRYDIRADYQRRAAGRLISGIPFDPAPARVLDVGCGTGHGARLMRARWPATSFVALDFAPAMLAVCGVQQRICADAEALPLADASVDFVWSNLTVQWCDAARVAREAARVLRPGGRLALSTLGPGTFVELRAAFAGVDAHRHTIDFCSAAEVREAFESAGLNVTAVDVEAETCRYPALRDLLASVRDLGANRVRGDNRRTGLMGKAAWRRFSEAYEAQRSGQGLPLTYETTFLYAEK